jgi:hypothetical protein
MDHSLQAASMRSFLSETSLTWTTYRTLSTRPFKPCEVLVFQLVAGPSSCIWEVEQVFGSAVPGSYSRTLHGNRVLSHIERFISLSLLKTPLYSICSATKTERNKKSEGSGLIAERVKDARGWEGSKDVCR